MLLLLCFFSAFGFIPVMQDTVDLSEVAVYAPALDRFAQGQKVISWKKSDLDLYQGKSLAVLLQEQSPVFIRQYGAGMLASPSFRGTSAGHTSVFWNGLPINSPSLGQSDLSILPVFAINQISLQFGSSGALFGNEAIGGSIHLQNKPAFNKGLEANISQQFGSFGLANSYLSTGYSTKRISVQTKAYKEYLANNFPYKDLGLPGTPVRIQDHAQFEQKGFTQDLGWNFNENNQLKTSIWWNQAYREIQAVMGSNSQDSQEDKSLRWVMDYFHFRKKSTWNMKAGLIQDDQLFNQSQNSTKTYFSSAEWDQAFSEKSASRTGLRYTLAQGKLSTYQTDDQRAELYHSSRFSPSEEISLSINLRQLFYDGKSAPFTPSIGIDWNIRKKNDQILKLKFSSGRGFKVPTLNDRYWSPGGNPNLKPEESLNAEAGLHWQNTQWTHNLTYYRMNVKNWIIWLPQGSYWSPENIRSVQNQGLEYQGSINWKTGTWIMKANWSYTYSRAITTKGISENDPGLDKQLPYTPKHQANARFQTEKGGFQAFIGTYLVGKRSVTAEGNRTLPAYQLFNLGFEYKNLIMGKAHFPVSFYINNILNTGYQVLYLRAMPGRSYQLNLSIHL